MSGAFVKAREKDMAISSPCKHLYTSVVRATFFKIIIIYYVCKREIRKNY